MSRPMSIKMTSIASTLSDKPWEQTQIKTFTKWVNLYLGKRQMEINNIALDFADGIKLINLLEIISDKKLNKYNKTPKLKIHQIANLNVAHEFLKAFYEEVKIRGVPSPEQINEADLKAILGLIWVLILRFSIADIDEGGLAAKEGLLLWCKRNTAGYAGVDPPGIEDFHMSWKNGLGFAALINKFRPKLLDYNSLDQSDPKACMRIAFQVAEEKLGIPPLLDPEDICDVPKPDEKSIMTYLAQYWKVFSADTKMFLASKRLNRAIERRLFNSGLRDEYLALAAEFLEKVEHECGIFRALDFGASFDALRNQYFDFEDYKSTTKAHLMSFKVRVESSYNALQSKLQNDKFPPYTAPEGLSIESVINKWQELESLEAPYSEKLTSSLIELFKQTFVHFDSDSSKTLDKNELQACFSALSLEFSEVDSVKLFGNEESISLEVFIQYMMEKLVDSSDKEQIRESALILSKNDTSVGHDTMQSYLGSREYAWIAKTFPVEEGGSGKLEIETLTQAIFSPL